MIEHPEPPIGRPYLETFVDAGEAGESGPAEPVAIYVHFPFCRHLCTYCDFDTFAGREGLIEPYVEALVRQIQRSPQVPAATLYLGGGTPGLLLPDQAAAVVSACRSRFGLPREAEVTIEVNPSGLDSDRLEGLRAAGFNRLSIGIQSVDARLLKLLGRRHRREEVEEAMAAARQAGFRNLSVDLLYGVPRQDQASWEATLEVVVGWGVEHVSCYMLTVEAGTPLERGVTRGTLPLPAEEEIVAMYRRAHQRLAEAGYRRYEISNWALPGRESAHNLAYWRNRSYLGIGAGAAGHWRGLRYKIAPDIGAYVKGTVSGRIPLVEADRIDGRRSMSDTLILGLRLEEGVSREEFRRHYSMEPEDLFGEALEWAEGWGLLERTEERLKLTDQGILLSNELFVRML